MKSFIQVENHRINPDHISHYTVHGTNITIYLVNSNPEYINLVFSGDGSTARMDKVVAFLDDVLVRYSR